MSWSENNNNNPWGSSGNGSGRNPGPNMDDIIRNAQNKFKGFIPKSFFGKIGPLLIIGILVLIWLGSGFYRVLPDEQGVVLQFGKFTKMITLTTNASKKPVILTIKGKVNPNPQLKEETAPERKTEGSPLEKK